MTVPLFIFQIVVIIAVVALIASNIWLIMKVRWLTQYAGPQQLQTDETPAPVTALPVSSTNVPGPVVVEVVHASRAASDRPRQGVENSASGALVGGRRQTSEGSDLQGDERNANEMENASQRESAVGAPPHRKQTKDIFAEADELIADFNRLASDFDAETASNFIARWNPAPYSAESDDNIRADENGSLFFVALPSLGEGVLLPSTEVARKWAKFYRSLSGAAARQELGAAYELKEGATLMIQAPARAALRNGALAIVTRGKLSGI